MFQLDLKSRKSICEQIIDGCKHAIIDRELLPGGRMPSVRELSAKLTVNPNTIQKAYRQLESEGWIYTVSGRGAFVSEEQHIADSQAQNNVFAQIGALVDQLKFMGVAPEAIKDRLVSIAEERRGADD